MKNAFWIEVITLCAGAAFGLALALLEGEPEALKRVAGQRARVVGALNGGTIAVASVAAGT